jgi:RNA polymerase II subunit A-like phosphatase
MTMHFLEDKTIIENKKNEKNLNLILDLDQTLIHTEIEYLKNKQTENLFLSGSYRTNNKRKPNFKKLKNLHSSIICEYKDNTYNYRVHGRLGLINILKELKDHFNIYIYTNGTYTYALNICKYIEKIANEDLLSGIIARSSKHSSERKYIYILPYFNIYNTIIIDDRYDVWAQNIFLLMTNSLIFFYILLYSFIFFYIKNIKKLIFLVLRDYFSSII